MLVASGQTLTGNRSIGNDRAIVLTTGGLSPPYLAATITGNTFGHNGDGILSEDGIAPSTITANTVTHTSRYAVYAPERHRRRGQRAGPCRLLAVLRHVVCASA